jgi:hypothetical protein
MNNADHGNVREFVRALANAAEYKADVLGFSDFIAIYWKNEAQEWVKVWDAEAQVPTAPSAHQTWWENRNNPHVDHYDPADDGPEVEVIRCMKGE